MGNYLFLLLILACPLMMIMMMRGGHGHGGHGHVQEPRADEPQELSTESLRKLRADVDQLISEREKKQ